MIDYDEIALVDKKEELERLKNKNRKVGIFSIFSIVLTLVLFFTGVILASQQNIYEKENIIFEYNDFESVASGKIDSGSPQDYTNRVKTNIKSLLPLYTISTSIESERLYGDDIVTLNTVECDLAVTESSYVLFLFFDNSFSCGAVNDFFEKVESGEVAEIRGNYTALASERLMNFDVDAEAAEYIAMELYLFGLIDEQDMASISNDPKNTAKILNKAINKSGAIYVNLREKNKKTEEVSEDNPTSKVGKCLLIVAGVLLVLTIIVLVIRNSNINKFYLLEREIQELEKDKEKVSNFYFVM